jgi:putative transcriptional regulator
MRKMFKYNLAVLAAKKGVRISTIARETGISRPTLTNLYKNSGRPVTSTILETLCDYFGCSVGELIEIAEQEATGNE